MRQGDGPAFALGPRSDQPPRSIDRPDHVSEQDRVTMQRWSLQQFRAAEQAVSRADSTVRVAWPDSGFAVERQPVGGAGIWPPGPGEESCRYRNQLCPLRWNAGDLDGYLSLYDEGIRLHGYSPEPIVHAAPPTLPAATTPAGCHPLSNEGTC